MHQDRARRQIERLAKDKEALHTQLQNLQLEMEKAQQIGSVCALLSR